MSYPDEVRRAERAAARKRQRRGGATPMAAIRAAELDRAFVDQYGETLPDDDAGADSAFVMANHLARRQGDPGKLITDWLVRRAPWMSDDARARLIAMVT